MRLDDFSTMTRRTDVDVFFDKDHSAHYPVVAEHYVDASCGTEYQLWRRAHLFRVTDPFTRQYGPWIKIDGLDLVAEKATALAFVEARFEEGPDFSIVWVDGGHCTPVVTLEDAVRRSSRAFVETRSDPNTAKVRLFEALSAAFTYLVAR